jgi:hypothetical protein
VTANSWAWDAYSGTLLGLTDTADEGVKVTWADAVLLLSYVLVAVKVTVCAEAIVPGAK